MSDDFSAITGIDPTTAKALKDEGFADAEEIANASLSDLVNVGNIDASSAPGIREGAKDYAVTQKVRETPANKIEEDILEFGISEFAGGTFDYSDQSQTKSPFTVDASGVGPAAVEKIHQNRSERAQDVDEQQNAPVTTDEEKWLQNQNRYDYPGVDTIPESLQKKRAEKAAQVAEETGAADRVEQKGSARNLQGKFSPSGSKTYGRDEDVVRVQDTANQPERTLAHEIGHAFDFAAGNSRGYNLTDELFGLDSPVSEGETEQLTEQAKEVSKKARGDFKGQESYRRKYKELTADIVGQAIIQPRATKRDAPELFDRLQDVAEDEGFEDAFPEPLANEPEPPGFLD